MRSALFGPVPWLVPGVLLSVVVGLVAAGPLAAALRVRRALAFAVIVSFGLIVSTTLTPLRRAVEHGSVGTGWCDLSRVWPLPFDSWLSFSDPTGNILLFIPLGLAIGLVPRSPAKVVLLEAAIVLPFVIETVQLLAPVLARGCEAADVVDNLTGLLIGLAAGTVLGRFVSASPGPSDADDRADPGGYGE